MLMVFLKLPFHLVIELRPLLKALIHQWYDLNITYSKKLIISLPIQPHRISIRAMDRNGRHSKDPGCTIVIGKSKFSFHS